MDRLKVRNGLMPLDILEIGKKTVKKASEFSFIKIKTNTKVCGVETRDMDRAPIGEMKTESWEENTLVIGLKIDDTEEEHFSIKMETDTMGIGLTESLKEKEEWFMRTKTFMKDNGMKVRGMAMAFWLREMEIILKDIGLTTWEKDKAVTTIMTKTNYSLGSG